MNEKKDRKMRQKEGGEEEKVKGIGGKERIRKKENNKGSVWCSCL